MEALHNPNSVCLSDRNPWTASLTADSLCNSQPLPFHFNSVEYRNSPTMTSVRPPPVVNFITGNANKLGEVRTILEPAIRVESQAIDIEEIQGTIEEVTEAKCRKAAEAVCFPRVFLFSSPLCV